jgi:ABC-type branched-subunit amino acid transport system ATPase component
LERFDLKENEMDEIVKGLNEAEAKELNHLLDKIRQGRE